MRFIEAIRNKFIETKEKVKRRKAIAYAHDTLIEVGDHLYLDDAILSVGYNNGYTPDETADFVIMLDDYLRTDVILWQQNKTNEEYEELLRNFTYHLERNKGKLNEKLPTM